MSNDVCYLYHICRERDKGDLTKGYVGISNNPERRWQNEKWQGNTHLKSALKKYTDIVKYVVVQGTRDFCCWLEVCWRPIENIGWNIATGGSVPPSAKGRVMSAEHKEKIGRANSTTKKGKLPAHGGGAWTPEQRARQAEITRGTKQSEATKEKKRLAMLGKKYPEVSCPHCSKIGRGGAMTRHHFDNCKHKEVSV